MAPLPCIGMGLKWRIEGELQSGPRTGLAQRDERKDKRPVRIQFLQAFAVRMSGQILGADGETRTRTAFATTPSR